MINCVVCGACSVLRSGMCTCVVLYSKNNTYNYVCVYLYCIIGMCGRSILIKSSLYWPENMLRSEFNLLCFDWLF